MRLTPNASQSIIVGPQIRDDGNQVLRARVTSVPEKNKANKALIALLAKILNLPKSAITISAGHTSQQKTIAIEGIATQIIGTLTSIKSIQ